MAKPKPNETQAAAPTTSPAALPARHKYYGLPGSWSADPATGDLSPLDAIAQAAAAEYDGVDAAPAPSPEPGPAVDGQA